MRGGAGVQDYRDQRHLAHDRGRETIVSGNARAAGCPPTTARSRSITFDRHAAGRDNCVGLTLNHPWANWRRTMIEVVVGDITGLAVDCIVNAANSSLMGGAGVDGAIHRGAGPRLLDECRRIGGCPTGDARMTGGYDLAARHVVHAVGPVWKGGMEGEDELLASCYRRSFELAEAAGARSIAFPAISTGAYGFPKERAAAIAVREMAMSRSSSPRARRPMTWRGHCGTTPTANSAPSRRRWRLATSGPGWRCAPTRSSSRPGALATARA